MVSRKSLLTNTRAASITALCVFMVATTSLGLAHDLTHSEHEQTEFCEALNSFGSNKAVILFEAISEFLLHSQIDFDTSPPFLVNTTVIFNQRSRAPPRASLIK